jgi:hypothetical protein
LNEPPGRPGGLFLGGFFLLVGDLVLDSCPEGEEKRKFILDCAAFSEESSGVDGFE